MNQISATMLFDQPQHEVASQLAPLLQSCEAVWIVAGFATPDGMAVLTPHLRSKPQRLMAFIVGAANHGAFDAFDGLLSAGIPSERLLVHLGHSRPTPKKPNSFCRYHPMLHSKIYLFDMPEGRSVAIIGSHNTTRFALMGLNAEAAVRLEGPSTDTEIRKIRAHIDRCRDQSEVYSGSLKEAYVWWYRQFLDGLRRELEDSKWDGQQTRTLLVLCEAGTAKPPVKDEVVYFEVPEALRRSDMDGEVHIFMFERLPQSPTIAFDQLWTARAKMKAKIHGIENEGGGVELQADWEITPGNQPRIQRAQQPFRPIVSAGMQQVRVKIRSNLGTQYDYMFKNRRQNWRPQFAGDSSTPSQARDQLLTSSEMHAAKGTGWFRVIGFLSEEGNELEKTIEQCASPAAGTPVMLSLWRSKTGE